MKLQDQVREFERRLIVMALRKTRGDVASAAPLLETDRRQILRRCRSLGIDPTFFKLSYQGQYTKKRREKLRSEGLCFNCEKQPSGGDGGTQTMCPRCAEGRRQAEKKRYLARAKPKFAQPVAAAPHKTMHPRTQELLRLAAMMPKRSVTVDDLKRQSAC